MSKILLTISTNLMSKSKMSSASTSNGGVRSTIPPGISTHSSYHPKGYGVSEGLKRARRPFAVRNAITGSAILGFCTAVYFYSISKVKQDDFSDLGEIPAATSTTSTPLSSSIQSSQPNEISSSNSLASKISNQASSIAGFLPSKASQPDGSVAETARAEILRRQGRI